MDLRQLEYLLAVCDAASFSAAARKMGVRQPSVSEQIRRLERELRQPLLDRLPGRVVPTAAGRRLAEHARQILQDVANASRQITDHAQRVCGPLHVGAIPTLAPFLFPRILGPFERQFPDVQLRLVEETTPQLMDQLVRGDLDLVIASEVPAASQLHAQMLKEEPLLLMLPKSHRLARQKQVDAHALEDERFLALHEMHCLAAQAARFCLRRGLRQPAVMHGSNLFTLALMVAAGAGITLIPEMMARDATCSLSGVAFRPLRGQAPARPITLVWSVLRYRSQAARQFADMVERLLADNK